MGRFAEAIDCAAPKAEVAPYANSDVAFRSVIEKLLIGLPFFTRHHSLNVARVPFFEFTFECCPTYEWNVRESVQRQTSSILPGTERKTLVRSDIAWFHRTNVSITACDKYRTKRGTARVNSFGKRVNSWKTWSSRRVASWSRPSG